MRMAVQRRKTNDSSIKTAAGTDCGMISSKSTPSFSGACHYKIYCIIINCFLLGTTFILWNYLYKEPSEIILSKVSDSVQDNEMVVTCSNDYDNERKSFPQCAPTVCKRLVTDDVVTPLEAEKLREVAKKAFSFGGSGGGGSILDLHSGALSKGDKFINVYKIQNATEIFEESVFTLYSKMKESIKSKIAEQFGIDKEYLYLTKPTFFLRVTTDSARTIHDEYWNVHVAKKDGPFHYTSHVYLTNYGSDFTGGRFIFVDRATNVTVEPKVGRLSLFTSGSENAHFVEKLKSGTRYDIKLSFTCDPTKAISDPKHRSS